MSGDKVTAAVIALIASLREELASRASPEIDPLVSCETFGAPRKTWNAEARSGKLNARKVGREYFARLSDARAWFESLPSAASVNRSADVEEGDELDEAMRAGKLRALRGGR